MKVNNNPRLLVRILLLIVLGHVVNGTCTNFWTRGWVLNIITIQKMGLIDISTNEFAEMYKTS
jgi:hypothetical protein